MITNKGKDIIAKYLLGQTSSYASYIAIGCGGKALASGDSFGDYSTKESLEFETYRMPVISTGYINNGGITQLVLTAELPTSERYEITEIGLFPAKSSSIPANLDSRMILNFNSAEPWTINNNGSKTSVGNPVSSLSVTTAHVIDTPANAFFGNASDSVFLDEPRINRKETPKYLNETLFVDADFHNSNGNYSVQLSGLGLDLSKNSPNDQIKLAFSLLNKNGNETLSPTAITIGIRFTDTSGTTAQKTFTVDSDLSGSTTNRYRIVSSTIADIFSSEFNLSKVDKVDVFISSITGELASKFIVAFDALRLENTSLNSGVYNLVGYTEIKNSAGLPIIKDANTSNFIEFRFNIGV